MTPEDDLLVLQAAAALLRDGGVVAHATEGVWGLAARPTDAVAVQRIISLKGRDAAKGLLLIGASAAVFHDELTTLTAAERARVVRSWPGAHTWVLRNRHFGPEITGGRDTIACRVPGHAQARALCAAVGGPLVSTSANRTGRDALTTYDGVVAEFASEVDMVLPGRVQRPGRASAIYGPSGERLR